MIERVKRRKLPPAKPAKPAAVRTNLLYAYQAEFLMACLVRGLSEDGQRQRKQNLDGFISWCIDRGIGRPQDITRPMLQRYQRHLFHYRKSNGKPLALMTQITVLNQLRSFFRWLTVENHLLYNPAADIEIPRRSRQLPKVLLSVAQVGEVLAQPNTGTAHGLRNRAILETLYSTGIRRSELARLKIYEVDTERGMLMVRLGKGRKDRLIPIGERACLWIDKYLADVRPQLVTEPDHGLLFVGDAGEPYEKNRLYDMVKRCMLRAGIEHGSCHTFRHAMATHMLEAGCDIRYIQVMLGHANLETTQIYTQVSIVKLKEIHAATHPARLERVRGDKTKAMKEDADDGLQALLGVLDVDAEEGS